MVSIESSLSACARPRKWRERVSARALILPLCPPRMLFYKPAPGSQIVGTARKLERERENKTCLSSAPTRCPRSCLWLTGINPVGRIAKYCPRVRKSVRLVARSFASCRHLVLLYLLERAPPLNKRRT